VQTGRCFRFRYLGESLAHSPVRKFQQTQLPDRDHNRLFYITFRIGHSITFRLTSVNGKVMTRIRGREDGGLAEVEQIIPKSSGESVISTSSLYIYRSFRSTGGAADMSYSILGTKKRT
jgi:hypothetical protein